ncbi:unnamed protein product, partial [Nesidiocoris tenuis]
LARRGVWHSPVASGAKPDPIQPGFAWLRKIRNVQQKLTPRVLQGAQCRILRNGIFSEFISSMDFEICSKWKYCDRPKIENRNGASEKTFSHTHLLRITSRTSVCVSLCPNLASTGRIRIRMFVSECARWRPPFSQSLSALERIWCSCTGVTFEVFSRGNRLGVRRVFIIHRIW